MEAILAITFTDKAAAEMRTRAGALRRARRAEARAVEGAWISTIHGFCARVLRAHALSAGIDPDFRVLGELESERIAADAFDGALGVHGDRSRAARDGGRLHRGRPRRHGAHRVLAPAQPRPAPPARLDELPRRAPATRRSG